MYQHFFKRFFDIVLSVIALVILSPLFVVVAILIRCKLGSPVIFRQQRPGRIDPKTGQERVFTLCKFRTMANLHDENGNLLPDADRLTKFGMFLRKTSIDELPELWCILCGKMSLIGPRPLLMEYLPYYNEEERHRHDVRPGLTGLAQVRGRNLLTWTERFASDVEYARNVSLRMDIKIIFMTVQTVLHREGVAEDTRMSEGNFAQIRRAELEQQKQMETVS